MTKVRVVRVRGHKQRRELFVPRRSMAFALFLLVSLMALMVSYTVMDNLRVNLDRADISIPTLPASLNGYCLLAISDLTGKRFGQQQQDVLTALQNARVDAIVFLGDMAAPDGDGQAFFDLIETLQTLEKPMYFLPGEDDPSMWDLSGGACKPSAFHQGLLDRNVKILDRPLALRKTVEGSLWLWPAERMWVDTQGAIDTAQANVARLSRENTDRARAELAYNLRLIEEYQAVTAAREQALPGDIHIVATHYPLTPARLEALGQTEAPFPALGDASLVLSGHYLAGQFRLPLVGALKVDAPELPRRGWFPNQQQIGGLSRIEGQAHYIARGLGARGVPLLRWRFFNPPEVAVLRLTSRVE